MKPAERLLTCALLTHYPYWPGEVLLASPALKIVALPPSVIGIPEDRNPFGLPEDDHVDVALVTAWWYRWLVGQHPDRAAAVMRELERHADVLVGMDGPSRFALTFPPSALSRFELVIKFQGLYRDRDLYNYCVGPLDAGANWTEKLHQLPERFRDEDLEKLRLSVPCFMTGVPAIRRRFRAHSAAARGMSRPQRLARTTGEALLGRAMGVAGSRGRTREVHCLTGLSHVQRIETLRLLEGFSGTRGITPTQGAAPDLVFGTEYGGASLPPEKTRELAATARPYSRKPLGRKRFLIDLRRHQVAVAPTGYGELTFRHAEALLAGSALVCQDLSHVEMMLPLRDRENVAFCHPDLSDLRERVEELLEDDELRTGIARAGRESYASWAAGWRGHLYDGIETHIREALGPAARP